MYTLQLLHASDLEGGIDAIGNAPNFAAVVDALEDDAADNGIDSILLSAGDNYIPGPFFNAGGDFSLSGTYEGFYNAHFELIDTSVLSASDDTNSDGFFDNAEIEVAIESTSLAFDDVYMTDVNGDGFKDYFEEIDTFEGRLDIGIMNALGFDASAVGNHEFDAGTDAFENIINYDSEEGNSLSTSRYADSIPGHVNFLQEVDTPGVQFPYLSANLDFSQDFDVGPLFTGDILDSTAFESDLLSARDDTADPTVRGSDSNDAKIAPATIIDRNGEKIGVVGATTQLVSQISSTGTIEDQASPGVNDMPALAALLQPTIDAVIAQGVNKVILTSHLQQLALEQELATLLNGVDIIVAGGSDTLLADGNDRLRSGDSAGGDYPVQTTAADGNPVLIVSTDGEYSYLGRLVVTFDDAGVIDLASLDDTVNGAYATDDQGVLDASGAATVEDAIAASDVATDVQNLTSAVTGIVTALDGDIAGEASVFLNGNRASVRTEETNLGNLTADANLAAAKAVDSSVQVSIKNGGGIRAPIGAITDNGDGTATSGPTEANPLSGKDAGEISELDIDNALRFDNGLVTVDLTPEQLKVVLEHAVSATAEGATPGQFPQVAGLHFSFDPAGDAQVLGEGGVVVTPGTRVQSVALVDEAGAPTQVIVQGGEVVADAPSSITVVTLNFLAGGGDGYPFSDFSTVTDLEVGEQQALSDYLTANFPEDGDMPFDDADTAIGLDARIQNLAERSDTVDAPVASGNLQVSVVAEFQGEGDDGDAEGASEVVAHEEGKLYVTNGALDRIDIFDIDGGDADAMAKGVDGYSVEAIHTIGETLSSSGALNDLNAPEEGYTPTGVLDGLGATGLNDTTVRVFANSELLHFRGNEYAVSDGAGGSFTMTGARIQYFDIDKTTKAIVDSGIAYNTVVGSDGAVASDKSFLSEPFAPGFGQGPGDGAELSGFSRFCSGVLHEAGEFDGRGLVDAIYFAGEEDGGNFNSVGGAEWALDIQTGTIYQVPAMGRGAWENVAQIDTGTDSHVAFILADDSSPFDADGDGEDEAAPLFMYVGEKNDADPDDFLARNGLKDGKLYVWVADTGETLPSEFNGSGNSLAGSWIEVDNSPNMAEASQDGSTGFDEYGYPTQRNLWTQAEELDAFGFSRPEDVAYNPENGSEFVLASTGVDTYDIQDNGNGADSFGTAYTMDVDFTDIDAPSGGLNILYDSDEDTSRALRSPDNLDWADDGLIYVQEDEAEEDTASGDEVLFGEGAANPNEAGIVQIDPATGETKRVANIDRSVVLDPTTTGTSVDQDAGAAGEWESSGILDVSTLFGEEPGSLFIFDVQAHGIEDQDDFNPDSRLVDGDLVEGGQLAFLSAPGTSATSIDLADLPGYDGVQSVAVKNGVVAVAISRAPAEQTIFGQTTFLSQPGFVALFNAETQQLLSTVDTGNLPDSLTFSADGLTLVVAGEGEFNEDSDTGDNPLGTVTIIDVTDASNPQANVLDFTQFNGLEDVARDAGVRIQDGVSLAEDLEPEFVAINPDGATAFVTLQENNAIAKIDLASGDVVDIFSMGTIDHSQTGLDANDRDDAIDIRTFDNLVGLRMADAIASFEVGGTTYIATANEGDGRGDAPGSMGEDEARVGDILDGEVPGLSIDESVDTTGLERLTISTIDGDTDGDGDIDVLHSFGSRSFTIYDGGGNLVFDSGDDFEKIIAERAPERFNDDDGDDGQDRSDNKGPEPEAITIGEVYAQTYAFIGLERDSGIMIYNVTDPANSSFVDYIPPKFVDDTEDGEIARHGPETIAFIPAEESSTGNAQIAVAYEISGSTVVYDLAPPPDPQDSIAINEIRIDQSSTDDNEFFELAGEAGTSLDGLSYVVIGDGAGGSGVVENVTDLSGLTLGDDGFFLAVENADAFASSVEADVETTLNFENSDNVTHLIVRDFAGEEGDDLDIEDDGVLDRPLDIIDSVGLVETPGSGDLLYSETLVGPDGSFVPGHVYRDPDVTGEFVIGAFTYPGDDTPGMANDSVAPPMVVTIPEIQGAGHVSALDGLNVQTEGIVTALDSNGYFLQDAMGDGDDATSDGIFVFTGDAPTVAIGDAVQVTGAVDEFFPGGAGSGNLSSTQITAPTSVVLSSGNALPTATILGAAGRIPPNAVVISPGETPVNLQTDPVVFNPETDGIDFYESLEGMLVTVDNPVAISATNGFGETWVVADDGAEATPALNGRGALELNADVDGYGDLNPERIQIQYDPGVDGSEGPDINVGDDLGDVTGVVGYGFGNFEVIATAPVAVDAASTTTVETTKIAAGDDTLTVATYNMLNVTSNPDDGDAAQIAALAEQIVDNLGSPDILALQEIQDDSGVTDDGTLDADETLQAIVDAIAAAGGPTYSFESAVVNVDGETGGVPGGNIRNAFLYNADRVAADEIVTLEVPELTALGVTDPNTFDGTRDPLLGRFTFNGEQITLINNHFSSRFGSEPIFGGPQPFEQGGEAAREAEATAINEVVDALLVETPDARIAVLGDLNTFDFTDELTEDLPGVGEERVLTNLSAQAEDSYTFNFQGNSQALDHIFVTDALLEGAEVDVVHTNIDFTDAVSDHDPIVAGFTFGNPGEVIVGTNRGDRLFGTDGDDDISGLRGHDRIFAGDGDDMVDGGRSNDFIFGGDGADKLLGGRGHDRIDGGDDEDMIDGGNGKDRLFGQDGDDMILGGNGRDLISGGDGIDVIDGGNGRDRIIGGEDDDILTGGNGRDVFVFRDDFGNDVVTDLSRQDDLHFVGIRDRDLVREQTEDGLLITAENSHISGTVLLQGFDEDDFMFV